VPVAVTLKVAVCQPSPLWLAGWVVIVGATVLRLRQGRHVTGRAPDRVAHQHSELRAIVRTRRRKRRVARGACSRNRRAVLPPLIAQRAVPVAVTLKVAVCPAVTLWLAGWVVIVGATAAALTVRVAMLLVALPAVLLTSTVNCAHCQNSSSQASCSSRSLLQKSPCRSFSLIAHGAVPVAVTLKVASAQPSTLWLAAGW